MMKMNSLKKLSDSVLLEAYNKALDTSLNKDLIELLEKEISHRNLKNK